MGASQAEPPSSSWADQYRAEFGTYKSCADKLELLIRDLLADAGIEVVDVESRAKEPDSFARKVDGKSESYDAPLEDVTDLIGVRVIAYYVEDVERISKIIANEFIVDEDNSADKLDDLEPDRFGYRSVHYIVTLDDLRSGLVEWAIFGGRKAEIQVRTATQHAWAAVEHKLNYKRTREAPRDLRRKLTRLSALFELADEQFSAVKEQLEEVEARYTSDVEGGNLDLPVDTASLEAFLQGNKAVETIIQQSRAAGFEIASPDQDGYRGRLERDLSDLVSMLDRLGIETIADLDAILKDTAAVEEAIAQLKEAFRGSRILWRSPVDMLALITSFQQEAPAELFESVYRDFVVERIKRIRGEAVVGGPISASESA